MKLLNLNNFSKWFIVSMMLMITLGIGFVDYFAGDRFSLFLFYIIPLFVTSWYVNRSTSIVFAMLTSSLWLTVDYIIYSISRTPLNLFFNLMSRFGIFTVIVIMFSSYRKIFDKLKQIAFLDEKTGIYNYRAFIELSEKEIAKASRDKTPLVLAYFDMDFLKSVNDSFGHSKGDIVLCEFAMIVKENIRISDIFARIGGDEFVALFINTDIEYSKNVLERIQESFNKEMIKLGYPTTISIGVTNVPYETKTIDEVVHKADLTMYEAKESGRNRIVYCK